MPDFLKKLPDGGSGTSPAQETVGVGDLNRVVGVLNGTDGTVGAAFFASNPASLKTSEGRYNFKVDYAAIGDGIADDTVPIANAVAAVPSSVGGIVYAPPGNFLNSLPIKVYRKTDVAPSIAPSIIGAGSGADKFAGHQAATKFTASGTFPVGEFMIDYLGTQTTDFAALCGYNIGEFAIEGQGRAAGIRQVNHMSSRLYDLVVNEPAIPAPADNTGTPTGAISLVNQGAHDYSYQNALDHVYVIASSKESFCLTQGAGSRVVAMNCSGIGSLGHNYNIGDGTILLAPDAQSAAAGFADYYCNGGVIIGGGEQTFGSKGNSLIVDNVAGSSTRYTLVLAASFVGAPSASQTEQNAALIRIKWIQGRVALSDNNYQAGTNTSDWVYADAGPSTGTVLFSGGEFNPNFLPVTAKVNLNSNTVITFDNVGGIVSSASGHATVPIGLNQTVVVNHGLTLTPSIDNIALTAQSSLFGGTSFDVSGVTSTQFTITVRGTSAGTSPVIGWRASLNAG